MLEIGTRVRIIGQPSRGVGVIREIPDVAPGFEAGYLVDYADDVVWVNGSRLEVVDDTKEEPAMEYKTLDALKKLVYDRMEYEMEASGDAVTHSYLLPLYLQCKMLDALEEIHNHLGSIEIAIMDLNPTYK